MTGTYNKGTILNVDLGSPPNEVRGHEQGMPRPCIVIKALPQFGIVIVLPFTSKKPKSPYYSIVTIPAGRGGLTKDSYVLCHQIRAVSYDRLIGEIGALEMRDVFKITSVLKDILEL